MRVYTSMLITYRYHVVALLCIICVVYIYIYSILYTIQVVVGVPFTSKIDLWSVGILLLELTLKKCLFLARNREELLVQMVRIFGPLPYIRFAGGKYSSLVRAASLSSTLQHSSVSATSAAAVTHATSAAAVTHTTSAAAVTHATSAESEISPYYMILRLRTLFNEYNIINIPTTYIDFLSQLLQYDPEKRMTAYEALQHPYLSEFCPFPVKYMVIKPITGSEVMTSAAVTQSMTSAAVIKKRYIAMMSLHKLRSTFKK